MGFVSVARATGWNRIVAFGLALVATAACHGTTDPSDPPIDYTVARRLGDAQTGPAGAELPVPLEVEVREPDGGLAKGVAVRFRITSGRNAVLSDTLVATGLDGIGRTRLRLGDRDSVIVAAAVRGQDARGTTFRALTAPAVVVLGVTPAAFAGGDTVLVRGLRLVPDDRGLDALFGSARARVVSVLGDTAVRVVVPSCLPSGGVSVRLRIAGALTNAATANATGVDAPLSLAVGEGVVVRGADAGCLRLGSAGQRMLIVPQYVPATTSTPSPSTFSLAVASLSAIASSEDPFGVARDVAPSVVALQTTAPPTPREILEATLRANERTLADELQTEPTPAPSASRAPNAPRFNVVPTAPSLGTTRTFRVLASLTGVSYSTVTARLRFAGTNILFYDDVGSPAPLSDDEVTRLGRLFDETLYRLDVATFGAESDIDGNGRVIVLTTPVVNAITPTADCSASGFVPGFFNGTDLTTRNTNSNRAEIFYAFVPDPKGERSCGHLSDEVLRLLPETFAHEFQHMISFNQHVLVRRGTGEATWLNEGLSHIAEELGARYYDDRYPAPSGRATPSQFLPDSAFMMIRGNLTNAAAYLANPGAFSVTAFSGLGTLEERGAAWLFLRWLGAQKGDAVFGRLVQTAQTSRTNVESATGETLDALLGDFSIALFADSVPGIARSAISPRYRLGQRTMRELLARSLTRPAYPLVVRTVSGGATVTGSMVQGTALHYQLTVPVGGSVIRLSAPGGGAIPASAGAQLGILRFAP